MKEISIGQGILSAYDPPRTQTWNLRLRRPTPYPLGQQTSCFLFSDNILYTGTTSSERLFHYSVSILANAPPPRTRTWHLPLWRPTTYPFGQIPVGFPFQTSSSALDSPWACWTFLGPGISGPGGRRLLHQTNDPSLRAFKKHSIHWACCV